MTIEVRYYSKSGNTKIIADAIAQAVGVTAKQVDDPLDEPVELLFLGGGVYAGGMKRKIKKFLKNITAFQVENIAVFSTSAGDDTIYAPAKEILDDGSTTLLEDVFHAPGEFLKFNKGRPNKEDLGGAAAFALNVIKKLEANKGEAQ